MFPLACKLVTAIDRTIATRLPAVSSRVRFSPAWPGRSTRRISTGLTNFDGSPVPECLATGSLRLAELLVQHEDDRACIREHTPP